MHANMSESVCGQQSHTLSHTDSSISITSNSIVEWGVDLATIAHAHIHFSGYYIKILKGHERLKGMVYSILCRVGYFSLF